MELKERYPGMEIKVLSENKLIIRTRNFNRGIVEIELLGLYLKGDTISIERISSIDSEISSENYSIYVRKDLNATQIQGDLDAGFSVFHNAVPVSLNLDYTISSDGIIDANMYYMHKHNLLKGAVYPLVFQAGLSTPGEPTVFVNNWRRIKGQERITLQDSIGFEATFQTKISDMKKATLYFEAVLQYSGSFNIANNDGVMIEMY